MGFLEDDLDLGLQIQRGERCPECYGKPENQNFVRTGQCGAGSVEGYTCTNIFHKGFRYADRLAAKPESTFCIDCGQPTTLGKGSARCPSCWEDRCGQIQDDAQHNAWERSEKE